MYTHFVKSLSYGNIRINYQYVQYSAPMWKNKGNTEAKYQLLKYKYLFLYIIISSLVGKSCHYKSLQNTSVSVFCLTQKNYKVLSKNNKYQKSLHARQTEKKAFLFNSVKPSGPVKKLCQVWNISVMIYSGVLIVLNHSWRQNTSTRHVKTLMLYLQANLPTRPLFSFIEQKGTWQCAAVLSETIYILLHTLHFFS